MVFNEQYINYNNDSYYFYKKNISLKYRIYGNSLHPPILLICGLGENIKIFNTNKFVKYLLDSKYYIICINIESESVCNKSFNIISKCTIIYNFIKGYFDNINKSSNIHFFDIVCETIIELLDILCIYDIHILGHSMGGMIVQNIFIKYPMRVKSLVLISTSYGPGLAEYLPRINNLYRFVNIFASGNTNGNNNSNNGNIDNQINSILTQRNRIFDLYKLGMKYYNIPIIIIHGDNDVLIPCNNSINMFNILNDVYLNINLLIINNMGHTIRSDNNSLIIINKIIPILDKYNSL
jgi:esterase/lipase